MAGDPDEYLGEVLAKQYASELDVRENIVRSLPLIFTVLGLIGGGLSFATSLLPDQWTPVAMFLYGFLLAILVLLGLVIYGLWRIVQERQFSFLDPGPGLISYRRSLAKFHIGNGAPFIATEGGPPSVDELVHNDLRAYLIQAYAEAAAVARAINKDDYRVRNNIFRALIATLGMTFAFVIIAYVVKRFNLVCLFT